MTAAAEALAAVRAAGGSLLVVPPDRLRVTAPAPLAPDLMQRLRALKAELIVSLTKHEGRTVIIERDGGAIANRSAILHVLVPAKLDNAGWRALHAERLEYWRCHHPEDEARRIAWGDLECRWHRRYGERVPHGLCAGCRQLLGEGKTLALGEGNIVHFDHMRCLLEFGDRWRDAARVALKGMGLQPPAGCGR